MGNMCNRYIDTLALGEREGELIKVLIFSLVTFNYTTPVKTFASRKRVLTWRSA